MQIPFESNPDEVSKRLNYQVMQVFINDKSFECAPGTTLHEVLAANAIPTGNIAIAVNFNVIPRPDWGKTVLQDGSKIIVIKAVQGG